MMIYYKNGEFNPLTVAWSIANSRDYSEGLSMLLDHYEGQWPPRTSYNKDEWPSSWSFYLETVDIMCTKLCSLGDVFKYRQWLTDRFNANFDDNQKNNSQSFEQVILDIYREIDRTQSTNKHSRVLFGFLGCLTKLCHSYRWGIAPLTGDKVLQHKQYELDYGFIEFPKYLLQPWHLINSFYGLPMSGTTTSVLYANIKFDDDEYDTAKCAADRANAVSIRYFWSDKQLYPQQRETENYSFLLFAQSVVKTEPLLRSIADALDFVFNIDRECNNSAQQNAEILNSPTNERKYIQLLDAVEKAYVGTTDHFGNLIRTKINAKMYIENVSGLAAWNLGSKGGASGAEQFLSQVIDDFLLIDNTNLEAHKTMLSSQRELMYKLEETIKKREELIPIELCSNSIKKKFYRIISRVKGWRINHRNKIHKILKESKAKQSATGNLQVDVSNKCPFSGGNIKNADISDAFWKSMSNNISICEHVRDSKFNYKDNQKNKINNNHLVSVSKIQWIIIIIMVIVNIFYMLLR